MLAPARPARAQDAATAAPPAFAIAQRLNGEAQAALAQGNSDIAHRRALQADASYQAVVASATYGHGPWGAEALYQEALVQQDFLHNDADRHSDAPDAAQQLPGCPVPQRGPGRDHADRPGNRR